MIWEGLNYSYHDESFLFFVWVLNSTIYSIVDENFLSNVFATLFPSSSMLETTQIPLWLNNFDLEIRTLLVDQNLQY